MCDFTRTLKHILDQIAEQVFEIPTPLRNSRKRPMHPFQFQLLGQDSGKSLDKVSVGESVGQGQQQMNMI